MATATPASNETGSLDVLAQVSEEQRQALLALRSRYQTAGDVLSAEEIERLRFLRWLLATGRIER